MTRVIGRLYTTHKKLLLMKTPSTELRDSETAEEENTSTLFKIVENAEIMRLQVIFDGKPNAEARQIMKSNGFRWSPSNSAWQRQLTNNGIYSTKRLLEKLKEMN